MLAFAKPFPHFEERKRGRSENLRNCVLTVAYLRGVQGKAALLWLSFCGKSGRSAFPPYRFYTAQLLLCVAKGRAKRLSQGFRLYAFRCFRFAVTNGQGREQLHGLRAPQAKGAPRFGQAKSVSAGQPLQWAKAQASRQGADKTIIYTENKQHKQIFMPKSLTITA